MTEQHLIHALREGNEAAFKILVESYKNQLYNTILGFIQNTEEAEDVLQDVFIKVFENIASFKNDSSLGTWMYRIAVTQSLDHIRRKNRKKRMGTLLSLFGAAEPIENTISENIHPGILAENKELSVNLFKAMQQLPDNQRAAFVLQKVEGLSQKEIGDVLSLSSGAIESLLSRAKSNLRKSLTRYYNEAR